MLSNDSFPSHLWLSFANNGLEQPLPSGKHTQSDGKSPSRTNNSTISTGQLHNSYVIVITRGYLTKSQHHPHSAVRTTFSPRPPMEVSNISTQLPAVLPLSEAVWFPVWISPKWRSNVYRWCPQMLFFAGLKLTEYSCNHSTISPSWPSYKLS